MRRAVVAGVVMGLVGTATPARAQEAELPSGKFGLVTGLRQGLGRLQDDFGLGVLAGVEAGWQPTSLDRRWSLGLEWMWLWGWIGADDPATISGALRLIEMDFGGRFRYLMSEEDAIFAVISGGLSLLRTNIPIPPATERTYAGGYAGAGFEFYLGNAYLVRLEARYGVIGGPGTLSVIGSFAFGR